MIIGVAATSLTLVALSLSAVAYLLYYYRQEDFMLRIARMGFYLSTLLIAFQAALLMWGILTHHFEWSYVLSYSSRDLSLYYLVSTFWAGQEGTFLLWLLLGSIYGFIILRWNREDESLVMLFMNLVMIFIFIILVKKNPFTYVWQVNPGMFAPGIIPPDGNGLNPLLQDPWMVIHPPILFSGYSSSMILFAFAMSALIRKKFNSWLNGVYPFALFTAVTLGSGIILGGYWSYTTLGWGGYWGWDPVENASFIPWVTSLVLVHGLIIQRRIGGMQKTNIAMALLTFVLVVYGSFLTRSGVLTDFSVHSFGSSELNLYLIAFVLFFLFLSAGTFLYRIREVKSEKVQTAAVSRESFILYGVLAMLLLALLTFVGTSSPLFTGIFGKASNVSTQYYNSIAGPIAIIMAVLISLAPILTWKKNSGEKLKKLAWHGVIAFVLMVVSFVLGMRDPLPLILAGLSYFLIMVNGELVIRMWRKGNFRFGGFLTHVGFGLMIIGIITSSVYDKSQKVTLPMNTDTQVLGYTLSYRGKITSADGKDRVKIFINGVESHAKFYWSEYSRAYMVGPAVKNTILQDLYVSPIQIIPADESWGKTDQIELKKDQQQLVAGFILKFDGYDMGGHQMEAGDVHLAAIIKILDKDGKEIGVIKPGLVMNGRDKKVIPADLPDKKHQLFIKAINVESGSIRMALTSDRGQDPRYAGKELLAVKVSVKPLIDVLWLGTILLVLGLIMAIYQQTKRSPGTV